MKKDILHRLIFVLLIGLLGACSGGQQQEDPELETEQGEQGQQDDQYGDDAAGEGGNNYEDDAGGEGYEETADEGYGDSATDVADDTAAADAAGGNIGGGINDLSGLVNAASETDPAGDIPGDNPYATDVADPNAGLENPEPPPAPSVAPVGSADRFVRYIATDGTPVFSSPDQGSQVANLNAGDVVVITIENGWGKIDDQHWVPADALSETAVPRVAAGNPWR